jgi:hypothetical protein
VVRVILRERSKKLGPLAPSACRYLPLLDRLLFRLPEGACRKSLHFRSSPNQRTAEPAAHRNRKKSKVENSPPLEDAKSRDQSR